MSALNLSVLLPLFVLTGMVGLVLILDRAGRHPQLSTWLTLTGLAAAPMLSLIEIVSGQGGLAQNALYSDGSSTLWNLLFCGIGAGVVLSDLGQQRAHSLCRTLILLLVCGALIVAQAAHLIVLTIGMATVYAALIALSAPGNRSQLTILGGIAIACLLMGSVCLYAVRGTPTMIGEQPANAPNTGDPLAVLGFGLYIVGIILVPATLITVYQKLPEGPGTMAQRLFLPLAGIAGLKPWMAALPAEHVLLLEILGALGIAVGYSLTLYARHTGDEWAGVAVAEFARLTLILSLSPTAPMLFYQAAGSVGAFAGLWVLTTILEHPADRGDQTPILGLGANRPYAGIALTLCLLSLSGFPPLAGAIGQMWLLRAFAERAQPGMLALVAGGQLLAWLWAMRWLFRLWPARPTADTSPRPLAPEAGTVLLIAALGCVLLGLYAEPLLKWIERMLTMYRLVQ